MAKSPYVPIRIEPLLLNQIDSAIKRANKANPSRRFTRSSWIKVACEEKIAHLFRSNNRKKKKKPENRPELDLAGGALAEGNTGHEIPENGSI